MVNRPGLDFSFSGLKTYTLNTVPIVALPEGELSEIRTAAISPAPSRRRWWPPW